MPAQARVPVNVRVPVASRDWLDEVAHEHRVDRSDVIRAALALAARQMPELSRTIESRR